MAGSSRNNNNPDYTTPLILQVVRADWFIKSLRPQTAQIIQSILILVDII